ncbi:unnamed protein product [Parascedosporium putredinis]|uniref:Uncharacterized protein n=1 Tax=Parascedosporium putredinis TaxID=1442378 RepID=A0A9P1H4Y8_9PEZI|nr:unnamed protein product [Parascedosporium putredinis]CAI7997051.1 unnamed protein product [Parascedosporium putredinis]
MISCQDEGNDAKSPSGITPPPLPFILILSATPPLFPECLILERSTYISMSSARVYKSITTTVVIQWDSGQTRSTEAVIRPLTTVWSAAPGCPTTLDSLATGLCVPPQWDEVWFRGAYYSPGICPSGYTAGCYAFDPEFAGVKQTRQVPELTPKADETAVICVPLGFECYSSWTLFAVSYSDGYPYSRIPAIDVRWKESDIPFLETSPQTPRAVQLPTSTHVSEPTWEAPETPTLGPNGGFDTSPRAVSGLSSGQKAGIAVGAVLGVACIASLLGWAIWRRRRAPPLPAQPVVGQPTIEFKPVAVRFGSSGP